MGAPVSSQMVITSWKALGSMRRINCVHRPPRRLCDYLSEQPEAGRPHRTQRSHQCGRSSSLDRAADPHVAGLLHARSRPN